MRILCTFGSVFFCKPEIALKNKSSKKKGEGRGKRQGRGRGRGKSKKGSITAQRS